LIALLAAIAAAATAVAIERTLYSRKLERERDAALAAERESSERLIAAKLAGADIPPPREEAPTLEEPLLPELEAMIADWEGEAARDQQRRLIRQQLSLGKTQTQVLRDLTPTPVADL
jgi:hypothetical protein